MYANARLMFRVAQADLLTAEATRREALGALPGVAESMRLRAALLLDSSSQTAIRPQK